MRRPLARRPSGAGHAPLHRQHQRDRLVGDVLGQGARRGGDADAAGIESVQIEPVMANAVDRDDLQRGQAGEQGGIDLHCAAAHHGADTGGRIAFVQREAFGERRAQRRGNGRCEQQVRAGHVPALAASPREE